MKNYFLIKWVQLLSFLMIPFAIHGIELNEQNRAIVCEFNAQSMSLEIPPDFNADGCFEQNIQSLDPQNKLIWVKIAIDADASSINKSQPLGLFISGKNSSKVFLNGHLLGNNGVPSDDSNNEQPGLIDSVLYIPVEWLKPSDNSLIFLMSAHHGFLQLGHPINNITIGNFNNPTLNILNYYWPSILPFGVLLLGFFYLGLVAWMNQMPRQVLLLPLMAFFAAAQLFIEVFRGLYAYPYPIQDLRLILILFFSMGFGVSLLAYVLGLTQIKNKSIHLLIHCFLLIIIVIFIESFDFKSVVAIILPVFIGIAYASYSWQPGQQAPRFVILLLVIFSMMIFLNIYSFIDTLYYYFVSFMIFMFMGQQAKQASLTRKMQRLYQARAAQLQQTIDQQTVQQGDDKLEIRSAGKVEWVMIKEIAYCKGAGDYVELCLINGSTKLFHGSITELSQRLPTMFLKSHRSYLVNTSLIKSLERNSSGTGQLILEQGATVPVSKRIMPEVKEKLS